MNVVLHYFDEEDALQKVDAVLFKRMDAQIQINKQTNKQTVVKTSFQYVPLLNVN